MPPKSKINQMRKEEEQQIRVFYQLIGKLTRQEMETFANGLLPRIMKDLKTEKKVSYTIDCLHNNKPFLEHLMSNKSKQIARVLKEAQFNKIKVYVV